MKKIILVAGGTGGHFFVAKAIGEELITRGYEVHFITDLRCQKYIPNSEIKCTEAISHGLVSSPIKYRLRALTNQITPVHFNLGIGRIQKAKLTFHIIDLKRYSASSLQKIRFFIALFRSVLKSVKLLHSLKPSVVVGFGGYPVVSSMFAAMWLRIPIIIHEQNSYLGKVNKFFAKFATKIALSYEQTKNLTNISENKIVITGGIVRESIRNINRYGVTKSGEAMTWQPRGLLIKSLDSVVKPRNDKIFASNDTFRIFIFGGSQGARIFSELLPAGIKLLMQKHPKLKLHIVQQAASDDQAEIKKIYSKLNISYKLAEFFDDIAHQYQNTDLVISRAGASTIEELTYIGLPAILIPLPTAADNHQYYNAKLLEDAGAGWCMAQSDTSEEKLADKILMLIKNPGMLEQASQNLLKRKKVGHKFLSDLIEEIVK
ncbi:undecaprenyldiphospho-muramoylpentapeptide beta-N-acetylglucosaminyltransferase [Rickettsia endosymbiont of Halotydeus destructor]|uniref:undecaprenyldiphospho-muramoylpentapeptide beta-N-acetylglucosaminyltransferase n=1 Tax=Rickettsia endosymbiont of Halotydeus destructor TaxID=2996754 RepID=UPI003BAE4039